MLRALPIALFCSLFFFAQARGQDVFVPRQLKAIPVKQSDKEPPPEAPVPKALPVDEPVAVKQPEPARSMKVPAKESAAKTQSIKAEAVKPPAVKETAAKPKSEKVQSVKAEPEKAPPVKEPAAPKSEKVQSAKAEPVKAHPVKGPAAKPDSERIQSVKVEVVRAPAAKEAAPKPDSEIIQSVKAEPVKAPAVKEPLPKPNPEKVQTAKTEPTKPAVKEPAVKNSEKVQSAKAEPVKAPLVKEPPANPQPEKIQSVKVEPVKRPPAQEPIVNVQLSNGPMETASTRLADGFDFPVGKPEAEGYYKARGFRSGGHMGEDWDGIRGGDTDFKDPIYSIGDGIVVFARDVHLGWGNVVIVRHAYRENGTVKHIDALYGHLNSILVRRGQRVTRGQQVGTMGTAHGQYDAHLHLEIRKNLEIGMSRAKFQKNLSNYHDPSQFIASHRRLSGGGASFQVAMNTFTHDAARRFDNAPNFSARKRSTAQSSAALKRAISSADR